jgi:hypothetical protein
MINRPMMQERNILCARSSIEEYTMVYNSNVLPIATKRDITFYLFIQSNIELHTKIQFEGLKSHVDKL